MTYEFSGTEDSKENGKIVTLIFKNAAQDETRVAPLDFYLGKYDTEKVAYRAQTDAAAALVHKGPYPADIPELNKG